MRTVKQRANMLKLGFQVFRRGESLGVGLRNECYAGIAIAEARARGTTVADHYGLGLRKLIAAIKLNNRTPPHRRNLRMFAHSLKLFSS